MALLPTGRAAKRDSHGTVGRPSGEVRVVDSTPLAAAPAAAAAAATTTSSPAKARMLWQEGFTPHEMANSSMNAKEVRRQEVIFEIIHTEADYVRDLRLIVDVLMGPMRSLRVVPADQVELIFGNVGEILALHEGINAAFMERQRQQYPVVWDISDVLLPFVPGLRVYARYICNQDRALALVDALKAESNNFAVFCRERQARPECRGLPMEAFLALPFQRLLKYPLLLRTLLDSTEGWSQQYANGAAVAEQVDAWIAKIQDARTKLDSFACIDALSRAIAGVDWAPLLAAEHRLAHAGPVRTVPSTPAPHARSASGAAAASPPGKPATMWLFDTFAVIAAPPDGTTSTSTSSTAAATTSSSSSMAPSTRGSMPAPGVRYTAVLRPSRIVEVLELAQCRGAPSVLMRAVPADAPSHTVSIVVGFASRAEYTLWRAKLDEHVRHTLEEDPGLSADILADAIARARIVDSEPTQCAGVVRSQLDSCLPSANASVCDIPTISVRDVYVQFPEPRRRGKLRRGWDMLRSKTEDITGHGIKHQLRKYGGGGGGGGGKRRATEPAPPPPPPPPPPSSSSSLPAALAPRRLPRAAPHKTRTRTKDSPHKTKGSPLAGPKPSVEIISTPIVPQSPSFVHIPRAWGPSTVNGGRESLFMAPGRAAAAPQRSSLQAAAPGTYHARQRESMMSMLSAEVMSPVSVDHNQLLSSLEFGSATMACGAGLAPQSTSARTSFTATPAAASAALAEAGGAGGESDSEFSGSEASCGGPSSGYAAAAGRRSGSTLFAQPPPPPLLQRMSAAPKPLPVPPKARKPAPAFEVGSARLTYGTPAHTTTTSSLPSFGDRRHTAAREPPARAWHGNADNHHRLSANSTESFCIIDGAPRPSSDRHNTTRTRTLV
ncbi:hypothetical protein H4R18_000231 [Coemansia javaensis]|uniref:DH domain-containing protein n=1 Tax=Coemansia javaensis TaxID=2761396 RepID=A0A9W8HH15_9FUNG|nr:hypothetical protein H4R18_000231 [Coemansia javaensis]